MIIKAFNIVWLLVISLFIAAAIFVTVKFKTKEQKAKDKFMIILGIANIIFFVLYKVWLVFDDFDFVFWKELPLQLCNINMFLIIIAAKSKNKFLTVFSSYVAPLGAIMAMTFAEPGFTDNSIFLLRNIGFYGTHGIILMMGILLFTLGYQKPSFKDIIYLLPALVVLSFSAYLVNNLFGLIVNCKTNYFFTCSPSGIGLLETFWGWIPLEYLYLLPAAPIFILYICGLNGCVSLINLIKSKIKKA